MNSTALYELFRSDVVDEAAPYLWKDSEVWAYMDYAYKSFVQNTGGVADFTSTITGIEAIEGEPTAVVSKAILRIMSARRASDGREVKILNATDVDSCDITTTRGRITSMVIGMQRGIVRWLDVPDQDETVNLHIYRLPLESITGEDQEFVDVDEHHHIYLLSGMKAMAYRKQDAETFDRGKAYENEQQFAMYCAKVTAEFEREKHKTRVVSYGGL